jgi:hypothetical protein
LADFFNSSPLKPLGQMNRNLVGSIYGWSSIKSAHFVPIHLQTYRICWFRFDPLTNMVATGNSCFRLVDF